jgi:hypothetical protein
MFQTISPIGSLTLKKKKRKKTKLSEYKIGYVPLGQKVHLRQVPVAHACNPSYPRSRDRDQEDCGSKPAWASSSQNLISKKPVIKKRAGGVAQGAGPEFKPQYHKKKKKEKKFT